MENEEEIIVDDTEETVIDTQDSTELEEMRKKVATLEAQKEHWRKKATETKETKQENNTETHQEFSVKDQMALVRAGVHEDDIDEVLEIAQFKKISVSEALKSDWVKSILSQKEEFRKTAEVSNTTAARKGATKTTDDTLLRNLSKGDIPESKDDAERLFWARRGGKR